MDRMGSSSPEVKGKGMRAPSAFVPLYEACATHPDLNLTDAAVHGYLARFRMTNAEAVIRPSKKRIAEALGVAVSTVSRSITRLQAAGFLTILPRSGKNGRKSNQYEPLLPGKQSDMSDSGRLKMRRPYTPSQNETACKRDKRGVVGADAPTSAGARDAVFLARRRAFYGEFSRAYLRIFNRKYVFTPQDTREITAALKLGVLDGLDLSEGCSRTLKWLRERHLSVTARAVVNNVARILSGVESSDAPAAAPEFDAARRRKELGLED